MSPHARDRARDKRRDKKSQPVSAQYVKEPTSTRQVLGTVAALVVVVGGLVGCGTAKTVDKGSDAQVSNQTASPPAASAPSVGGCVAPPQVPTDKRTGTLPDKKTAAGKTFIAKVTTNCGVITMELDGTKAPQTVA